jgi:hypothetical protein
VAAAHASNAPEASSTSRKRATRFIEFLPVKVAKLAENGRAHALGDGGAPRLGLKFEQQR